MKFTVTNDFFHCPNLIYLEVEVLGFIVQVDLSCYFICQFSCLTVTTHPEVALCCYMICMQTYTETCSIKYWVLNSLQVNLVTKIVIFLQDTSQHIKINNGKSKMIIFFLAYISIKYNNETNEKIR